MQLAVRRVVQRPPGERRARAPPAPATSSRMTATRPVPGRTREVRRGALQPVLGGRLERDRDPLALRPGPDERARDEQHQHRPASPPTISASSPRRRRPEHERAHGPAERVLEAGQRRQHQDRPGDEQEPAAREEPEQAERPGRRAAASVTTTAPSDDRPPAEAQPRRADRRGRRRRPPAVTGDGDHGAGLPGQLAEARERRLDLVDLLAVGREVAVAERRLGELEVGVRVVDEAVDVGRQLAAGRRRGRRARGRGRARRRPWGRGVGRGRRAPGPAARAARRAPRAAMSPQTMVVGLATMIFWNSGNAAEVDCR